MSAIEPDRLAAEGRKAEIELTTRRGIYGRSCGRFGQLVFDDPVREGVGIYSPPIEAMVGGLLGEGGRVRITVEVIEPGELRENPWPPPVPIGDGSWAAWEDYCTRKAVRVFSLSGGFTTAERIRGIEVAPHAEPGSALGVKLAVGHGGAWVGLDDLDGIEILKGDESSLRLIEEHGLAYRIVEGFSPKRPRGWHDPATVQS